MQRPNRLQICISHLSYVSLEQAARAHGLKPTELAKRLIEQGLEAVAPSLDGRDAAEAQLRHWVEAQVERLREEDAWDEHVTLRVFERIANEIPGLYEAATAEGHRTRVNRQLGGLIRRTLGARTRRRDGVALAANAPRGVGRLIMTYTLLFRDETNAAAAPNIP